MHIPSLLRLLAAALTTSYVVTGFQGPLSATLSRRYASALVGLTIPVFAAPAPDVFEIDTSADIHARSPEAKKKKKKKAAAAAVRAVSTLPAADIDTAVEIHARSPDAKKKKKKDARL